MGGDGRDRVAVTLIPESDSGATAFIYSDRFGQFDYGPHHPFRIERLALTRDLCRGLGLLDLPATRIHDPAPASVDAICRFHRAEYLGLLREANDGRVPAGAARYGLGTGDNPVFPGVWDWSLLVAGASLLAMELVEAGAVRCAFNIAGGLHHAMPDRASGFCYLNDAAVLIAELCRRGRRVAYVDIDAHHGDGVQWGFYDTDQVLTISLHETGATLFPGTGASGETGRGRGEGYAVNLPLLPGTDDEVFLWAFDEVVPPLLSAFAPDVVVTQLGVDAHRADPLSHLALSLDGFVAAVRRLRRVAPRWIALGGGGYSLPVVAHGWAAAWAVMNDQPPPKELPAAVRTAWQVRGFDPIELDEHPDLIDESVRAETRRFAETQVDFARRVIFPRHGL